MSPRKSTPSIEAIPVTATYRAECNLCGRREHAGVSGADAGAHFAARGWRRAHILRPTTGVLSTAYIVVCRRCSRSLSRASWAIAGEKEAKA